MRPILIVGGIDMATPKDDRQATTQPGPTDDNEEQETSPYLEPQDVAETEGDGEKKQKSGDDEETTDDNPSAFDIPGPPGGQFIGQ